MVDNRTQEMSGRRGNMGDHWREHDYLRLINCRASDSSWRYWQCGRSGLIVLIWLHHLLERPLLGSCSGRIFLGQTILTQSLEERKRTKDSQNCRLTRYWVSCIEERSQIVCKKDFQQFWIAEFMSERSCDRASDCGCDQPNVSRSLFEGERIPP